jgi:hypothetical protein
MKQLVFGVFLPLLILVFNGFNFVHAVPQIQGQHNLNGCETKVNHIANSDFAIGEPAEAGFLKFLEIKITEIEIEEYEIVPPKRMVGSTAILAKLICALSLIYFFITLKKRLEASTCFSDITSKRRHLVFQVFRL